MSRDLNKCMFIGRIGKDPESKYTASGSAVVNFSLACGDDYTSKDGKKVEQTNWVNFVCFGKQAETIAQYCQKGSQLYAEGKQVTRKWQDQSGNDRYSTEINLTNFQFLGGKSESKPAQSTAQHPNSTGGVQPDPVPDFTDSDIPF